MKQVTIKQNDVQMRRQDWIKLVSIVILGFFFRLFLMRYRFAACFDEINYLKLAASGSLEGVSHVFHTFWTPFYPFVVSVISRIISDFELAGRLVSIFSGSVILIPVFFFTKYHFDKKIAFYSTILLAFYPSQAFLDTGALTESLFALLLTIAIIAGWFVLSRWAWPTGFILGILIGLAYLTRPEGIGLLIVFSVASISKLIHSLIGRKRDRIWLATLCVIFGFILVAAPYLLYLHRTTGVWTISGKEANQQGEVYAMIKQGDEDVYLTLSHDNTQLPVDRLLHIGNFMETHHTQKNPLVTITPMVLLKKYAKNLYHMIKFVIPRALTTIVFTLMMLGLVGEAWSKKRTFKELYLLAHIIFFWFVVFPVFHIKDSYLWPFIPLCFIWVGKGWIFIKSWVRETLHRLNTNFSERTLIGLTDCLTICVLIGGLYAPQLGKILVKDRWSTDYWADPVEQKIAGAWLKKNTQKIPIIISRGHSASFYAGNYHTAESVTIPQNNIQRILAYARHRKADYLLLDERYLKDFIQIKNLLDEEDVPKGLKKIFQFDSQPGLKTVIYEIIKDSI